MRIARSAQPFLIPGRFLVILLSCLSEMFSRTISIFQSLRVSAFLTLTACLCAGIPAVIGQDEGRASPPESVLQDLPAGPHLIFKDPTTGNITSVPGFDEAALKKALEAAREPETADFEFTQVSVSGDVTVDRFVRLNVIVRVLVNVKDQRVVVPAGFNEFNLLSQTHQCETPESWGRYSTELLPQKSWLLYGAGEHLLKFEVIGQLRTTANGQTRFRLQSPVAPISNLTLQCNEIVESAALTNKNLLVIQNEGPDKTSVLKTWELAALTEINWIRKPTEQQQQSVSVRVTSTDMQLDLRTDPGSLVIDQNLMISGGSINRLSVRLPKGFTNVALDVLDLDGNAIIPTLSQNGSRTDVRFADSISGPITLTWDMELTQKSYPQTIGLTLPDLRDVSNQTGRLEVFVPYGLDVKPPVEKNTRRIRVSSESESRTAAFAYRLLSTDSRIDLSVSETEAFYTVAPHINLNASREEGLLEMKARFKVNVVRGSRSDLSVVWPTYLAKGWRIEEPRLMTGDQSVPVYGDAPDESVDEYLVKFPERQSGEFIVELKAFRTLDSVLNDEGRIFLPDISSPTPHTSIASLFESDTDSILLKPADSESSLPILPSSRWPESLQQETKAFTVWLVDNPSREFQLELKAQEPEVGIDLQAEIHTDQDSLMVHQTLMFDVRHDDLTEIRLKLPGRRPVVQLVDTAELLTRQTSSAGFAVYSLPEARRGQFQISVDYVWTPPQDAVAIGEPHQVPLAMPPDASNTVRSVVVATNDANAISISDSDWQRIYHPDFPAAWESSGVSEMTPLLLSRNLGRTDSVKPRFVIMNSAVIGPQLLTSLSAVYDSQVNSALFTMDTAAELISVSVDGVEVPWEQISATDDVRSLIQLRAPAAISQEPRNYRLVVRQPLNRQHHLFSIVRPELPTPAGRSSDDCHGIWILSQTGQQSLFSISQQTSSIGGSLWNRFTGQQSDELDTNFRTVLSPYEERIRSSVQAIINQNLTGVSRSDVLVGEVFSDTPMLVVVSGQSIYLLIAVLALGTYMALLRLSASRLILAAGIVAVIVAGTISMTPTAIHLLLLRALPGCLLALIAALVQRWVSRDTTMHFQGIGDVDANTVFTQTVPSPSQPSTMSL